MLAAAGGLALPAAASAGELKAGAAVVDASWHVGASAGQYASDGSFVDEEGTFDPSGHSTRRKSSYGIQSRMQTRAIVIDGPKAGAGDRFALVKNDFYIPQDLVYRRAGQILQQRGVLPNGPEQLTMTSTHDHSSPMYSSTSWGVWTFQDVFDVRFYNYYAEKMADAVEKAAKGLVPVRVGAAVGQFDKTHRHSFGPAIADDGTPAGYPNSDADHDMTVVRFDDISDPGHPKPLANLVNFGVHPEFLDGNDLISSDYVAPVQKMTDQATGGAVTFWTQGAVGTAEPERSSYHSIHERLEFTHHEYKQVEYGARLMSDHLVKIWDQVGQGSAGSDAAVADPDRFVPFDSDFGDDEVAQQDRWFPGPITHPYPQVSNCRSDSSLKDPLFPVIGLPDCSTLQGGLNNLSDLIGGPDPPDVLHPPIDPGLTTDDFERAGVPVPENYGAPGYSGLEEDIDVHLQAFRIGDILFTVCSCEQWKDQSKNIKTRTDRTPDNEHLGFDWKQYCAKNNDGTYGTGADGYGTGTWKCPNPNDPNPGSPTQFLPNLSDQLVERMHRQVVNPANGWNDAAYAPQADSEPTNLTQIKGNYTHDDACKQAVIPPDAFKAENDSWDKACGAGEESPSADLGYKLTVAIAMGNDYNGYIATYREFQRGDHYRKALTGWGPHSSDYMASRLVNMGRVLNGGDPAKLLPGEMLSPKVSADLALNDDRAEALGNAGSSATQAYEAGLPNDGGGAAAVTQPPDVERFDGTFFTWNGGSNFTDNPNVKVQRKVGAGWEDYAGQAGEIPVTIQYPQGPDAASYETGSFEWHWTAHFEAFASPFKTIEDNKLTPAGVYRFVVDGERREGGGRKPYHLESKQFVVNPWSGISVDDLKLESDRTVSFQVGPRGSRSSGDLRAEIGPIDYPDTYNYDGKGPLPRFIETNWRGLRDPAAPTDVSKIEWFCDECSFRPWLDTGDADKAKVTFVAPGGPTQAVDATLQGGRWVTSEALPAGGAAVVGAGCVQDGFGDYNGKESARVGSAQAGDPPTTCAVEAPVPDDRAQPGGGAGSAGGGGQGGNALGQALGDVLGTPLTEKSCARPVGRIRGATLGRARLGATRAAERGKFPGFVARRSGVDRFCLRGGGNIRIGYMSVADRSALARRRRRGDRAVLILTTSRRYSVRRVRHGTRVRTLRRRLRGERSVRVGRNRWYLVRGKKARLVFKTFRGKVEEVGVANSRLTRGKRRSKRFLRAF